MQCETCGRAITKPTTYSILFPDFMRGGAYYDNLCHPCFVWASIVLGIGGYYVKKETTQEEGLYKQGTL